MFNSNATLTSLLGVDNGGLCTTPKTPEILNSLMALTNPLDNYNFTSTDAAQHMSPLNSNHQISQDSSHSSCSGSPLDSPAGSNTTPSVQQTCSQLIKAGLKLSIQSKRKMSSGDSSSGNEQSIGKHARKSITGDTSEDDTESRKSPKTGLTPEDEDRRRRRRERNKIAATKCRMKKRERTNNLVSESEQLETQNKEFRNQLQNLETERRKLLNMLDLHVTACIRPGGYNLPANARESPGQNYLNEQFLPELVCEQPQQIQNHAQQSRTAIPPMTTIKYSRNGQRNHSHTNGDLLPNGYCKPSPTTQEIGYLSSPTQDGSCLHTDLATQQQQHLQSTIIKTDYIPNCENSDGGTAVDNAADFVLKSELVDSQSPYTTVQSANRFLFETNCDNYDIKHSNNNNNNNNTNNNNTIDFHHQIATTPTNCSTFENLLIKTDFLPNDTELLAQFTDGTDPEFTDLDSGGVTAYAQINNGCLA